MDLEYIEKRFCAYVDKFWKLSDIGPFLLAYLDLLLLFKGELSEAEVDVVRHRQRQLRGENGEGKDFEEVRKISRHQMDRHIKNNTGNSRGAMLNRLLYCALLDSDENDFFYLTEPMFEFVKNMQVSPDQLKGILESEFVGFKL